jgi:hypothetical protein
MTVRPGFIADPFSVTRARRSGFVSGPADTTLPMMRPAETGGGFGRSRGSCAAAVVDDQRSAARTIGILTAGPPSCVS